MNIIKKLYERYRIKAGLILLIAVIVYANVHVLITKLRLYPSFFETDPVTIHETRINKIKKMLPPFGFVGYVTTVENEKIFTNEKNFYDVELLAQYILTQYTLAPVFVYNSPDYPLVVGNFLSGPPDRDFLNKKGLTPLKDFGDGLFLFKNENKK